jgi:spore coat protein U-like protein
MITRSARNLAAVALAIGAFGFAPLTAQADLITVANTLSVTATIPDVIAVTNVTPVDLGSFDPRVGNSSGFSVNVDANTPYTIKFSSTNGLGGSFALVNGSFAIPYTVKSTAGSPYPYLNGSPGETLTDAAPSFMLNVPALATGQAHNAPAGAYADTLTIEVAPVS